MDELLVGYNPGPAAERVAHYHGLIRSRIVWFVIGLAICTVIWWFQRSQLTPGSTAMLYVIGSSFSVAWVVIAFVGWLLARQSLKSVGQGVALRIDRGGIEVSGSRVDWPQVSSIAAARGSFGVGPNLAVTDRSGGTRSVPLSYLDAMPGTIDSAVRAYSAGRIWLDTAELGN